VLQELQGQLRRESQDVKGELQELQELQGQLRRESQDVKGELQEVQEVQGQLRRESQDVSRECSTFESSTLPLLGKYPLASRTRPRAQDWNQKTACASVGVGSLVPMLQHTAALCACLQAPAACTPGGRS